MFSLSIYCLLPVELVLVVRKRSASVAVLPWQSVPLPAWTVVRVALPYCQKSSADWLMTDSDWVMKDDDKPLVLQPFLVAVEPFRKMKMKMHYDVRHLNSSKVKSIKLEVHMTCINQYIQSNLLQWQPLWCHLALLFRHFDLLILKDL